MTFHEFKNSLQQSSPDDHISPYLMAMWQDAKENWTRAHELVQDLPDATAAWIHAYLHRKEGDIWNADYWYRRAGRIRPDASLEHEWEAIVKELL